MSILEVHIKDWSIGDSKPIGKNDRSGVNTRLGSSKSVKSQVKWSHILTGMARKSVK